MELEAAQQHSILRLCKLHSRQITVICKQIDCMNDRFICGDCWLKFHKDHQIELIEDQNASMFTILQDKLREVNKIESTQKAHYFYQQTSYQIKQLIEIMALKSAELLGNIQQMPPCLKIDKELLVLKKLRRDIFYENGQSQKQIWEKYLDIVKLAELDHSKEASIYEKLLQKVIQAKNQTLTLLNQIIHMAIEHNVSQSQNQPNYSKAQQPFIQQQAHIAIGQIQNIQIQAPILNSNILSNMKDKQIDQDSNDRRKVPTIIQEQVSREVKPSIPEQDSELHRSIKEKILFNSRNYKKLAKTRKEGGQDNPIILDSDDQNLTVKKSNVYNIDMEDVKREIIIEPSTGVEVDNINRKYKHRYENMNNDDIESNLIEKINLQQPIKELFLQCQNNISSQNSIPQFLFTQTWSQRLKDLQILQLYGYRLSSNQQTTISLLNILIKNFRKLKYLAIPKLGRVDLKELRFSDTLQNLYCKVDFDRRFEEFVIDLNFDSIFLNEEDIPIFQTKCMLKALPNLTNISLAFCGEESRHTIIKNAPNLQNITLGPINKGKRSTVSQETIEILIGMPNIRCLGLFQLYNLKDKKKEKNDINDKTSFKDVWNNKIKLRTVIFYKCSKSLIDDEDLKIIAKKAPAIQQLFLSGQFIGHNIWEMKFLKTLHIEQCETIDLNLCKIQQLVYLQVLTLRLRIKKTEVADRLMQKLASLNNLKFLNICENHITTSGMNYISKLQKIQTLICGGTRIVGSFLPEILANMKKLKRLSVCNLLKTEGEGSINDEDMIQISKVNTKISHLTIYSTKLTAKSISNFKELRFLWAESVSDQWARRLPQQVALKLD